MKTSEQLDKIAPALAKAQGLIEGAVKDKTNPAFRSKYADLGACWDACRKELTDNGISVIQANVPATDGITITTRLLHASGQWIEDDGLYLPATKKDAQGFGSAMTYARRYALCAMVGIAPEDDDGNAASKKRQDHQEDAGPLSEEQVATITAICDESTPSRLPGLLASYKAKSLDEIPANEYGRIIAILRKPKK